MPDPLPNLHGRKPGRGIRPWILLPKVLFVAFYLGGLAATLVVWLYSNFASLPLADPRRLWTLNLVGALIEFFVVPALLGALLTGLLLLLQHPRQFLRMRWLIVKLVALALLIPSAHLYLSSRLALLRHDALHQTANSVSPSQVTCGLALVLAASSAIVILGRLKPRLGQNWARSYAASVRTNDKSTL